MRALSVVALFLSVYTVVTCVSCWREDVRLEKERWAR